MYKNNIKAEKMNALTPLAIKSLLTSIPPAENKISDNNQNKLFAGLWQVQKYPSLKWRYFSPIIAIGIPISDNMAVPMQLLINKKKLVIKVSIIVKIAKYQFSFLL